ncbi:MAG: insulinase family protein, partial [Bacteroidetes bacterium]
KKEIVDGGFQILEDWAHNVTFDGKEIDAERGIIMEEWRSRGGLPERVQKATLPKIFKGSRYIDRVPIGDTGIIKNFKHDVIRRFYKDWYRPDLMGVMVVGDIDIDEMEKKIKFHFGRIAPSKNPRKRETYDIPDHKTTEIAIFADKEQAFGQVQLLYKKDGNKMKTLGDYRQKLVYDLYNTMLNDRLEELTKLENAPFMGGFAFYGQVGIGFKNAYQSFAQVSESGALKGLTTLLLENKRALQFGFTEGEFERAKKNMLSQYESQYNERNKTSSGRYVSEYVQHFLEEEPSPGIEFEYEFIKNILPSIQLAEINPLAKKWITNENRVVSIVMPEKTGVTVPTEKDVLDVLAMVEKTEVKPYEDKSVKEPLMVQMPTKGSIVGEKKMPEIDATELTLSNGAKVVYKKTNFKDDQIIMGAFAKGGHSLAPDADFFSASAADQVITEAGLRVFSSTDLKKVLTGKNVEVSPFIEEMNHGMSGESSPKDFETMFQLMNLYFTAPRKDVASFKSFTGKYKGMFKNLSNNPNFYYAEKLGQIMSQNHPRSISVPKAEHFDKIDLDKAFEFYKARFANAANFTFTFVGAFDEAQLKQFVELYIASLPADKSKPAEQGKDLGIRAPKGKVTESFNKGKDPKSQVMISITNELKDEKDAYFIRSATEVLGIKVTENLREDKAGVYSPRVSPSFKKEPIKTYSMNVSFTCAPENVKKLVDAVYEEIDKLAKNGPSKEDLDKVKEAQRRDVEKNSKENFYWSTGLRRIYYEGSKPESLLEAKVRERIEKLSEKDIKNAAKKYFDYKKTSIVVSMMPEKIEEKASEKGDGQKAGGKNDGSVTVEKVLDKYIEAIGGKAKVASIKSYSQKTDIDMMGQTMSIKMLRKEGKFAIIQSMAGAESKTVIANGKGFAISPRGSQDLSAEEVELFNQPLFIELDYVKAGLKAQIEATEKVDGRDAHKVVFKKGDKTINTKWYDTNSGLELKNLNQMGETFIKEYQEIKGIKFPKKSVVNGGGMEIPMETIVDYNIEIPDSEFQK